MSEVKKGWHDFGQACMDTPFNTPSVKRKGVNIANADPSFDFGLLVSPAICRSEISTCEALGQMIAEMNPATVVIRGHGWPGETPFVWRGTAAEFNEQWVVD